MRAALLLVDLQRDFLDREDLDLPATTLTTQVASLLSGFREAGASVVHIHTVVSRDGEDRMPHWKRTDRWECVEESEGVLPPAGLQPFEGEPIFQKTFFSGFTGGALREHLRSESVDTVVIVGVYTHGCVREAVLDAYQAGFEVRVAGDCVASYNPLHAAVTREYLDGRACRFFDSGAILREIGERSGELKQSASDDEVPVAFVGGDWITGRKRAHVERNNPSRWSERLAMVPVAQREDVDLAAAAADRAQRRWAETTASERAATIADWAAAIQRRRDDFIELLAREVGKPPTEAAGEVGYALALMTTCMEYAGAEVTEPLDASVTVRRCPRGVVGVITPWNNPLALPVGKIAPALIWGNAVVWKPAMEAPRLAQMLLSCLAETNIPAGCLNMVFGGAPTAHEILRHPLIRTISFTGSDAAGRQIAIACAAHGKALQAELGGNNAAIVTARCDVDIAARELAAAAYSFSGQRCTAVRRIIMARDVAADFTSAFIRSVKDLTIGNPSERQTRVGPLVSRSAQQRIDRIVSAAVDQGAVILCGGRIPDGYDHGCWYEPTVLHGLPQAAPAVQDESFGPVSVLSEVGDFDEAVRSLNGVRQGLVAVLYSDEAEHQQQFLHAAEAGILRINSVLARISPHAPFGGWKSSGLGPPEHGIWDREMYTRPQAVYGGTLKRPTTLAAVNRVR